MVISMVIFDYDGTLVDSLQLHVEIWKQVLREVGVKVSEEELRSRFGMTAKDILKEILPKNIHAKIKSISKKEASLFIARLNELKLMPNVREVLNELKSRSIPMAIATSIQKESLEKSLTFLDIRDYFDYIITGEEVSRGKPRPEILLKVARKALIKPESCLVVGDAVYDAEAAIRARMNVIIVGNPYSKKLEKMKVTVVDDFKKILPYVFA